MNHERPLNLDLQTSTNYMLEKTKTILTYWFYLWILYKESNKK